MIEWFDRLIAEGEAGIDRLIAERTQETVELDFKTKTDATNGRFADSDKRVFAKALSAFSNSAGGLLIWGVDARKVDEVDCAQAAAPIANVEAFQSQAQSLIGQLLRPHHDGIRLGVIASRAAAGSGFLLVAVERSERRPHRSEAANQRQYFKRAGDNSFEMEHYDIEDSFRRSTIPELSVEYSLAPGIFITDIRQSVSQSVNFLIGLRNAGRLSARGAFVSVPGEWTPDQHTIERHGVRTHHYDQRLFFECPEGMLIHPGTARIVAPLRKVFSTTIEGGSVTMPRSAIPTSINVQFGCADMSPRSLELTLYPDQIAGMMQSPPALI